MNRKLIGTIFTLVAGAASILGINVLNVKDYVEVAESLDAGERLTVAGKVREIAADGRISADERASLREEVTALDIDSEAADLYAAEIEPALVAAAEEAREGLRLATEQRFDEARRHFVEATRLDADDPTSWANLAGAALEAGSFAEAEAAARHALSLDEKSVTAHYNLGACLAEQERVEPALDHLARAIDLLLHGDAAPAADRRALLADLERSPHFIAVRSTSRFAEMLGRLEHDGR